MSMCLTPNSLSASTAAATMLGVEPSVPASPTPLAPSGFTGVGVHGGGQLESRKVDGARNRVIHERSRHQLAVLVVNHFFDHRLADTLGEATVNLTFDDERIDAIPGIVYREHFEKCRFAGLAVNFEHRDVAAERIRVVGRFEERFVAQSRLETFGKGTGT